MNHYIEDARTIITAPAQAISSTDAVPEGTSNLYYTAARFDTRLATKSTDNLAEGSSNLYFTSGRAVAALSTALALKADDSSVVHKTGDETIDGYKNITASLALGKVTANKPTGNRVIDLQFWAKNNADIGGVHFSVIVDADGAAIGNRAFGIWGYPHKTADGTIAGYERFIKCSFPTYDGNTTYTKQIELDAPIQVIDGHTVTIGTNVTQNYKRLAILGNSDTERMIEWGDG